MYRVILAKKARKSLEKLPKDYPVKIKEALLKLGANPFQLDLKKMDSPADATHRLRVGSYRLFLLIDTTAKEIIVSKIKRRTTQTYHL